MTKVITPRVLEHIIPLISVCYTRCIVTHSLTHFHLIILSDHLACISLESLKWKPSRSSLNGKGRCGRCPFLFPEPLKMKKDAFSQYPPEYWKSSCAPLRIWVEATGFGGVGRCWNYYMKSNVHSYVQVIDQVEVRWEDVCMQEEREKCTYRIAVFADVDFFKKHVWASIAQTLVKEPPNNNNKKNFKRHSLEPV